MKKQTMLGFLMTLIVVPLLLVGQADARSSYMRVFNGDLYPAVAGTKLDACVACHVDGGKARNPYGLEIEAHGGFSDAEVLAAMLTIESNDSDGDGYSNIDEINALTFPGDASDFPTVAPVCTDNDSDGFALEGGDCGPVDCNDNDLLINPDAAEVCTDALDNDCNGTIDCQDKSCETDSACVVCTDNDGDGYAVEGGSCGPIDCNDFDLAISPGAVENCTDLIDNDCDGLIDCVDGDCSVEPTCDDVCIAEATKEKGKKCSDGLDNDCDGVLDAADPDCGADTTEPVGSEGKGQTCYDGLDNDGDGLIDCADSDCAKARVCK